MTNKAITKLASKLTKSLATEADITEVKTDIKGVKADIKRLKSKIDYLDSKAHTILEFAEIVDETVSDHRRRLKRIEAVSI